MLAVPKYHDLDLPVYGEEIKVLTRGELSRADGLSTQDFFRHTNIWFPYSSDVSLATVLAFTDDELERVANSCEAKVVNHEWGLQFVPNSCYGSPRSMLPKHHRLIAKVAVIDKVPDEVDQSILDTLSDYRRERRVAGKWSLSDMYYCQFMLGTNRLTGSVVCSWLVDIEPRIKVHT